jgi:uncharacterized protein YdhG (YjbR/CyaY superfamily)
MTHERGFVNPPLFKNLRAISPTGLPIQRPEMGRCSRLVDSLERAEIRRDPMTAPPSDVAGFLAKVPEPARQALKDIRETIRAAAPEATERIGYGVPAFYHHGRALVSYGAAKSHCSLYVQSPAVIESFRDELSGYDTSKGTIHFQPGGPLPADLVTRLIRARMAEIDAR